MQQKRSQSAPKLQTFPGGACPQTPLGQALRACEPPSRQSWIRPCITLVPRQYLGGRGKMAWAPLLVHVRIYIVPINIWEFVHIYTSSTYAFIISPHMSTSSSASCYTTTTIYRIRSVEKSLDMPILAYYGICKLLKVLPMFYQQ